VFEEEIGVSGVYPTIKDMYEGVKISVRTSRCDMEDIPIDIRPRQGSTLSSFLSAIVMDELIKRIQDEVSRYMLFVNDIILINKTRDGHNSKLEQWRHTSEFKHLD